MNTALTNYERYADLIKLQSSRNDFVNKLMVLDPSNPEITKNTTFPDTIKNNDQVITLLKQKVDELIQAERENLSINTSDTLNQVDAKEIEKLKIILKGLKSEEDEVNSKINEREQYKQKLLDQAQDIKSGIQLLRPKNQNAERVVPVEVTSTNIPDPVELQQKVDNAMQLLEGLKALQEISAVNVDLTEFGNLRVKVDLDAALGSIEVILDYDGRVKAVEVTSESKSVDDSIILADTRSFVPPQDLRFALFAAVASLRSLGHIRDDVSELRKRCLVKMVEPYVACITTANGLVATVALHYCYPSVPNGVVLEALTSSGFKSTPAMETLRGAINALCFSNLTDLFDYLINSNI